LKELSRRAEIALDAGLIRRDGFVILMAAGAPFTA
jgi:hypothetical protein